MRTIHSLKEVLLVSILSLFLGFETQAQPCEAQGNLIVSTGINPITQTVLPPGSPDPMWTLIQSPPAPAAWPVTIGAPAFVIAQYGSWDATPSPSAYINAFNTNSSVANNWNPSTTIPYIFERPFCLCNPNGSNEPMDVTFDLRLHCDNWAEVYLVDISTGTQTLLLSQPTAYSTANFTDPSDDALVTHSLTPGDYALHIHQRNQSVAMGVSLFGELSSSGLLSDNLCDPDGAIVGNKFEDIDGNGVISGADGTVAGWTINLYNNAGTLVATTTTDGTGFYSFNNLAPGTYTVTEVPQAGWTMVNPASGSQTITVSINAVTTVNFLNKKKPVNNDPCDFELDIEPKVEACGLTIQTNISGLQPGYEVVSTTWTFGDGYSSDLLNPSHYYLSSGVYTVCLKVTVFNGKECCTIEKCFEVKIEKPCENKCDIEAKILAKQLNNCAVNFTGEIVYTGTAITNWFWDFGDGTTGTGYSPTHNYSGSGTYVVTLTVFGYSPDKEDCCFVQIRREIKVECKEQGKARMAAPTTTESINNVVLHPNPSNGVVNLSFDLKNDDQVSISIVDVNGKVVYEHTPAYKLSGSHTIEISTELPKGVYTSVISTESYKVTKKLIIM